MQATSTSTALFNSAQLIQCATFSMIHSLCTQLLVQDGCLESVHERGSLQLLLLLCELPGGARNVLWQTTWSAGQRHGAISPDNGMPQLSTALTQLMWTTLVGRPVLPSVTGRAQCCGTRLQTQRLVGPAYMVTSTHHGTPAAQNHVLIQLSESVL